MMPHSKNRRTFLKQSAATATAIASAPLILKAQDKSGSREPVVGSGEYTYRCQHFWGNDSLPTNHDYGNASHGVAVDKNGLIYITHQGRPDSVYVFDGDGKFVKSMGDLHTVKNKAGSTAKGHGIDIRDEDGEEFIYLSASDSSMSFAKVSMKGEVVWTRGKQEVFEHAELGPKTRYRPTNTSFRPDGGYYLGDGYGSAYLYEYNAKNEFVRKIGGPGTEDGKFRTPHGQWLDDRDGTPKLVVADRANARLQWFDMDGKHVQTLDGFLFPADIDSQGDLLLVPDLHARITILDKANKSSRNWAMTSPGANVCWIRKKRCERAQKNGNPVCSFIHTTPALMRMETSLSPNGSRADA